MVDASSQHSSVLSRRPIHVLRSSRSRVFRGGRSGRLPGREEQPPIPELQRQGENRPGRQQGDGPGAVGRGQHQTEIPFNRVGEGERPMPGPLAIAAASTVPGLIEGASTFAWRIVDSIWPPQAGSQQEAGG